MTTRGSGILLITAVIASLFACTGSDDNAAERSSALPGVNATKGGAAGDAGASSNSASGSNGGTGDLGGASNGENNITVAGDSPDAGTGADAGEPFDAGGGTDAGSITDAGEPSDAGGGTDAGGITDAGEVSDAATDAGGGTDAGEVSDAGIDIDAATPCDASVLQATCDDGNSCTFDRFDEGCACVNEPLRDGAECDDGEMCTDSDRCIAGQCFGQSRTGAPRLLGSIRSFGNAAGLDTVVGFLSERRALYATGTTLSLVEIVGDSMRVLDRRDTAVAVKSARVAPMIWAVQPATFIFPLDGGLAAVVTSQSGIDLYDTHEDRLTLVQHFDFSGEIRAAAGAGRRIWLCDGTGSMLYAYVVDPATGAIAASGQYTRGSDLCQSLALGPDGNALLVASSQGLNLAEVSATDGTVSSWTRGLAGHVLLDARASADYIVAYELSATQNLDGSFYAGSGYGDVWVLAADSLNPITTFPMDLSASGRTPIGFTFAAGGLLLERATTQGCGSTVAGFYSLGLAGSTILGDSLLLQACQNINPSYAAVPSPMTAWGNYAVIAPTKQMVRVNPETGVLSPLIALEQGSFERVRAASPNIVEVHSPLSMHLVDISRPEAPIVKSGGIVLPNLAEGLRLEVSNDRRPSFLNVDIDLKSYSQTISRPLTSVYWASDHGGLPTLAGSLANEDDKSEWLASGRSLYQLAPQDDGSFHLTRLSVSSIDRADNQKLTPDLDQFLTITPSISSKPNRTWFGVDPQTRELAIVEERSPTRLNWFSLGASGYELEWSISPQKGSIAGFAIAGGLGVIVYSDCVLVVSRFGEVLARRLIDKTDTPIIRHSLAFTGKLIYLATGFIKPAPTDGVLVLRADDLSEVARYPTPEKVRTIAEVGEHLVFGMPSTLMVADPACQ